VGEDVISMGCLADGAAWTIGQEPTDALVEKARVDAKARSARVIRLGQPVTMEYNGGRLNLHVGSNGKVKAHLGGGLKLFVVELDPESGLLRSANGHPMVQCDLKSLARALRTFVKQGVKTHVTKNPIDLGAGSSAVHILDLHKSGKLWKRVAVDSGTLLPVKWWDYNDEGSLHSFATWEKLATNQVLSDQLFTMKGDVKSIKDKQVSQTINKEIQD